MGVLIGLNRAHVLFEILIGQTDYRQCCVRHVHIRAICLCCRQYQSLPFAALLPSPIDLCEQSVTYTEVYGQVFENRTSKMACSNSRSILRRCDERGGKSIVDSLNACWLTGVVKDICPALVARSDQSVAVPFCLCLCIGSPAALCSGGLHLIRGLSLLSGVFLVCHRIG